MTIPEGWTDDLNINLAQGRTVEELVEYIIDAAIRHDATTDVTNRLMSHFGLSQPDAELAVDRTMGGVVRAATGRADNCPNNEKDPVAWASYHKCLKRPELILRLYPNFKRTKRPWWRRLLS